MKSDGLKPFLPLIPTSEATAVPARLIWEALGRVGTVATVKAKLNALVKAGAIEKRHAPSSTASVVSVYFRMPETP
jgi:hypothetical protein